MKSTDALWAIIYDAAGLVDVMEADTRLNTAIKGKLTHIKTFASQYAYTEHWMDNVVAGALKQIYRYVRN